MTASELFTRIEQVEKLPHWTPQAVGANLNLQFNRDDGASDETINVFRSARGVPAPFESVELRQRRADDRFGLIVIRLQPTSKYPMEMVVNYFGTEHSFSPPNPRAVDTPTAFYEYKRGSGMLRVVFQDFQHYSISSFVLDRT